MDACVQDQDEDEEEIGEQDSEGDDEDASDTCCDDMVTHATSSHEAFFMHWLNRWTHGTEEERVQKKQRLESFMAGTPYDAPTREAPQKHSLQAVMDHARHWKSIPADSVLYEPACDKLCDMLGGLEEADFMAVGAMIMEE